MATTRQYRKKIKSAKNITKITKAMQMVAASKMKKAQQQALEGRDYSLGIADLSQVLSLYIDPTLHPLLNHPKNRGTKELIVMITPEKGLCGAMLTGLARSFLEIYAESLDNLDFILVGKKSRNVLSGLPVKILGEFSVGLSQPKYESVPPIARMIQEKYLCGEYQSVSIIFSHFINTMSQVPEKKVLLPLDLLGLDTNEKKSNSPLYVFEPSAEKITNSILPMYLEIQLYQCILDSYASEQSARMVAMKNATDNALDLINELTVGYNKARQASITAELTDISASNLS